MFVDHVCSGMTMFVCLLIMLVQGTLIVCLLILLVQRAKLWNISFSSYAILSPLLKFLSSFEIIQYS